MTDHDTKTESRTLLEKIIKIFSRKPHDREQLIELLKLAKQRDILDDQSLAMMRGILTLSKMRARDIMIPRSQMTVIDHDAKLETILPVVIESAHSRFPVIENDRDSIVGILLAKDLLAFIQDPENFSIQKIMRPVVMVPESKRLDVLLKEFRLNRNHMAVVVDEYGGTAGLITIEDILEEIVGDIEDEYDIDDEVFIRQINKNEFIVNALTPISEFNDYFHANLSDEEFDTIGGIAMKAFAHLPKRGEKTRIGKYQIKILNADDRRIKLLLIKK